MIGLPSGQPRHVAEGEALFRQGDPSIGLVRVVEGAAELRRVSAGGQPLVLHRAGPGETLAEASLFEPWHHCDAVAVAPALLRVISLPMLRAAARADPELPWRLAAHLAHGLAAARGRMATLSLPRAEDRLMEVLGALPVQPDGSRRPPGSWMRLAQEIGLAHETVYRTLARLERSGALRRRGGAVWLGSR